MTPKQRAEQLEREGKCIMCGTPTKTLVRGLCRMHHGRFKASLKKLKLDKREGFEAMLIESGQLLPNRQGRRVVGGEDEFAKALERFERQQAGEDKHVDNADVERIVAEGADLDERLTASAPPMKREPSLAKRKKSAKKSRQ